MSQISYGTITITDVTDIDEIVNYYLIADSSTDVQIIQYILAEEDSVESDTDYYEYNSITDTYTPIENPTGSPVAQGWYKNQFQWQTSPLVPTAAAPYLWNYEEFLSEGGLVISITQPHVIGTYGQEGIQGRGITSVQDYYLATSNGNILTIDSYILAEETSVQEGISYYTKDEDDNYTIVDNPTGDPSAQGWYKKEYIWNEEVASIDSINKFLWNYERISYSDGYEEFLGPRLIGVYGDQGLQGEQGVAGTSSYTHIRYSANEDGTNSTLTPESSTRYIAICVTSSPEVPAENSIEWVGKWSLYVGENGASVFKEVPLYYLKVNVNPTQPLDGSIENISNIDIHDQWTTVIPSYQPGGIYYTCLQTFLTNTNQSPIYSEFQENPSLTESKSDIKNLKIKTKGIIQNDNGLTVVGGTNAELDPENINTYGYNSIAAPNFFALRYNDQFLNRISTEGFEIYNPTTNQVQVLLDNNGLTLKDLAGRTVASYGQKSVIGDPTQAHITIDPGNVSENIPAAINFYTGQENSEDSELNKVASMTGDYLSIARTLVFEQMQLGANKWAWKYDNNDDSIILKWIG